VKQLLVAILILVFFGFLPPAVSEADVSKTTDTSVRAKKRADRERQFLYRSLDEVRRSHKYVLAEIHILEKYSDVVDTLEPLEKETPFRSLSKWYEAYSNLLTESAENIETDLSNAYSDEVRGSRNPEHYDVFADGYEQLGVQLAEQISHLEKRANRVGEKTAEHMSILDYISSTEFAEERLRYRKQLPPFTDSKHQDRFSLYKDITDAQVHVLKREIQHLGTLQKHYFGLIEVASLELFWMDQKIDEYAVLRQLARFVGRDITTPIAEASKQMIRLYESEISKFNRKVDEIYDVRTGTFTVGSRKALDRAERMSESYEEMRNRYEHNIKWLKEEAGTYRADLAGLEDPGGVSH